MVLGANAHIRGQKNLFLRFMAPIYVKRVQPSFWATWLLERDDRVARACGLELACRRLADRRWPEPGMGTGVYVIPISDGYVPSM